MTEHAGLSEALGLVFVGVQRKLEAIYQLEPAPDIAPFVRVKTGSAGENAREEVIVRQSGDSLEMVVLLPESSVRAVTSAEPLGGPMDAYLGAIEGVSHFIHLAERARTRLPTTLLELELQAEVDKFALLSDGAELPTADLRHLHRRLYEDVRYLHGNDSETGQRYRLANDLAARLWSCLMRSGHEAMRGVLRRFYRASQAEKIRIVAAA